jgi:hypothetical protein
LDDNAELPVAQSDILEREERFPVSGDVRLTNGGQDFAERVVIDISRAGVGIDGLTHLPPMTRVRIDFPNGRSLTGRMRRRDIFTSGVAFDVPLTDSELCALWTALRNNPCLPRAAGAATTGRA